MCTQSDSGPLHAQRIVRGKYVTYPTYHFPGGRKNQHEALTEVSVSVQSSFLLDDFCPLE